jgi:hypothetical protein
MALIGVQPLIDILALSLQSVFVKNEKNGVSLLLIAKPEAAKTSSIFKYNNLDFVSYYDEITQKKMIDEFFPLVRTGQKRTLLIPDLINCIEKQKSTRDQFLNMIKSGIDDTGIIQISTYHKQLHYMKIIEGVKFNLITAITTSNYKSVEKYLKDTGILSRFIPFSYDYPISLVKNVFGYIEGDTPTFPEAAMPKLRKRSVKIDNSPELFKNFEIVSIKVGMQYSGYGIRAQQSLQRLAKANAIMNDRDTVTEEDIRKILQLSNWINFNFNSL